VPDILYGEVLLKPEWSQPTLSAQEIRQNTGVPPAPQPVIPPSFTIQLYNPPQQIIVKEKRSSWGPDSYSFDMPQYTFRTPSGSALDRSTNDPTADATTPHLKFVWRKEGKLSTSNLVCYLTGKSTDTNNKKKGGKEPDIAIALLTNYKDLTIYESNFHRVDMEDYKGLEVVLILSTATIRDVYCGQRKDAFNMGEAGRKNSGGILGRKKSSPMLATGANGNPSGPSVPPIPRPMPAVPTGHGPFGRVQTVPAAPPPDPRAQWEIDAETTRLRKQQESERRLADARRRERERAEETETLRLRKMIESEEKERRRKAAEVEKETARLLKKYGNQAELMPALPLRPGTAPHPPAAAQSQMNLSVPTWGPPRPPAQAPRPQNLHPQQQHLQTPGHPYGNIGASVSSFFHAEPSRPKPKKSFLGLRRMSDAGQQSTRSFT
jgi:hypothetical protein